MAPVPQTLIRSRPASCRWVVLLAPLFVWASGCATLHPDQPVPVPPPTGVPAEVLATWNPNVVFAPDPTNNGRSTPALTGRVYLIDGPTEAPVVSDGTMVVCLYDEHPKVGPDGAPVPLEAWKITPECLKLSARKDVVGWGYSLSLPWGTYRPEIGRIQLQVRFQTVKDGLPLYRDSGMFTLQNTGGNAQVTAKAYAGRQQVPGPGSGGNPQGVAVLASGYGNLPFTPSNGASPQGTVQVSGTAPQGQMSVTGTGSPGLMQLNTGDKAP